MNAALLSSAKMDWETPDEVLSLVREVAPIGLDPATTPQNPTGADVYWTPVENGLTRTLWGAFGMTYMNPPYGRELAVWMARAHREAELGAEIIALVPARPDTGWWHRNAISATRICFWRGRIRFRGAPSSAPFPSAFIYWGVRGDVFERVFAPHGWVVRP